MGCMVWNSRLFMVGGEKLKEGSDITCLGEWELLEGYDRGKKTKGLNMDIFVLDRSTTEKEATAPLVPVRDGCIPRMHGPKTCPIVATIGDRCYVLSTYPRHAFFDLPEPVFEAFDFNQRLWVPLPPPPFYSEGDPRGYTVTSHFVWRLKLFVWSLLGPYFFDVVNNEWQDAREFMKQFVTSVVDHPSHGAAEFEGFLIGKWFHSEAFLAYDFDSDGRFKSFRVLAELDGVFHPPLYEQLSFVINLGNEHMCLLLSGIDESSHWSVRIAIFQVFIESQFENDRFISAVLHSSFTFNFGELCRCPMQQPINSVFVLCEDSGKGAAEHVEVDSLTE